MISQATSRAIYDDAMRAYEDATHPCHIFTKLQSDVPSDRWQLPEPFNGQGSPGGVVFLGLNPNYSPAAHDVPTITTPFDEWDDYYRHTFDGEVADWPRLYRRYQELGQLGVGPHFRLGVHGLVLEVVRYRSHRGQGCNASVLQHEQPTTLRLLAEANPSVVIANGAGALWGLSQMWPAFGTQLPKGKGITSSDVEGVAFHTSFADSRSVTVIPVRHLSGGFGRSAAVMQKVAAAVRDAISRRP